MSISDARVSATLDRAFVGITGRSQVLGPKKQTVARRLIAPTLAADAPPLTLQGLISLYKQVLAVPVPAEALAPDAQAALLIATGAAPAAAPIASASAAAATSSQ